jgi:hypothetical protein
MNFDFPFVCRLAHSDWCKVNSMSKFIVKHCQISSNKLDVRVHCQSFSQFLVQNFNNEISLLIFQFPATFHTYNIKPQAEIPMNLSNYNRYTNNHNNNYSMMRRTPQIPINQQQPQLQLHLSSYNQSTNDHIYNTIRMTLHAPINQRPHELLLSSTLRPWPVLLEDVCCWLSDCCEIRWKDKGVPW